MASTHCQKFLTVRETNTVQDPNLGFLSDKRVRRAGLFVVSLFSTLGSRSIEHTPSRPSMSCAHRFLHHFSTVCLLSLSVSLLNFHNDTRSGSLTHANAQLEPLTHDKY